MPNWEDCIVHRHHEWIVFNKPCGFSVQELSELWSLDFTAFHPVHRLDKETSGLWLVALTSHANQLLSQQFQTKNVNKAYLAITENKPNKKQGKIVGDMARSRRSQWQLLRSKNNPAITLFKSIGLSDGLRLVLCRPLTGKTHQIRVAMKSLGSAVAGDSIYAAATATQFDRMYLHAYCLAFSYLDEDFSFQSVPDSGKLFSGDIFSTQLKQFAQPFELLAN